MLPDGFDVDDVNKVANFRHSQTDCTPFISSNPSDKQLDGMTKENLFSLTSRICKSCIEMQNLA